MPRSKRIITLPNVEAGSYDPGRPLSKNTLLLNQVMHFRKIEREQMNEVHTPALRAYRKIEPERMTEGQAAEYIQRMTAILHPKAATTGGMRSE